MSSLSSVLSWATTATALISTYSVPPPVKLAQVAPSRFQQRLATFHFLARLVQLRHQCRATPASGSSDRGAGPPRKADLCAVRDGQCQLRTTACDRAAGSGRWAAPLAAGGGQGDGTEIDEWQRVGGLPRESKSRRGSVQSPSAAQPPALDVDQVDHEMKACTRSRRRDGARAALSSPGTRAIAPRAPALFPAR